MTTEEFKIKYANYAHLEGDELWDKMTEVLLESDNLLHADPNQVKTFKTMVLDLPQNDGSYQKSTIHMEVNTRWLNNKGEEVQVKEIEQIKNPVESYKCEIIDFN